MPNISIQASTALSFLGLLAVVLGIFLILGGAGIVTPTIIQIVPGRRTLIAGLVLSVLGMVAILPEVLSPSRSTTPSATSTSPTDISSHTTDVSISSTDAPLTPPQSQSTSYCYGKCWQYNENDRTMTWTSPIDGREDVWQGDETALSKIRSGWTAIFGPASVPGEIEACILNLNGQQVKNACDGVLYQVSAEEKFRFTSENLDVGGFRWKPAPGYGYRAN